MPLLLVLRSQRVPLTPPQACPVCAGMESDGGVTSDGGLSDGGGRRKKPALLRAMFTDDEGMDMFTTLCK